MPVDISPVNDPLFRNFSLVDRAFPRIQNFYSLKTHRMFSKKIPMQLLLFHSRLLLLIVMRL